MFKNICWVNWLFMLMIAGLALLSLSSMLTGCGNKGALVLPDNTPSQKSTPIKNTAIIKKPAVEQSK